jgi:hypothetical protein
MVAMVLVAVGLTFTGAMCSGPERQDGATTVVPVVSVGEETVSLQQVTSQALQQQSQYIQFFGEATPQDQFNIYGQVLGTAAESLALQTLGREMGISLTDEEILETASDLIDETIAQQRAQLQAQGVLEPDATPSEFEVEFQNSFGQTPEQFRQASLQQVEENLAVEEARAQLEAAAMQDIVLERLSAQVEVSREELREDTEEFSVLRLPIQLEANSQEENFALAEEVREALAAGETTMENALSEYAPDAPPEPLPLPRATLESDPNRTPVTELEEGEFSRVIDEAGTPVIYQLTSIDQPMSEDEFDTVYPTLVRQEQAAQAQERVEERVDEILDGGGAEWNIGGFKVLYDAYRFLQEGQNELDEEARRQRLAEISEEASLSLVDDPAGAEPAALTAYVTYDEYLNTLDREPSADELQTMADKAEEVINYLDGVAVRLRMAEIYSQMEVADLTGENLVQASLANNVSYEQYNQENWGDILQRLEEYQQQGLIEDPVAEEINQEYQEWLTEYQEEMEFREQQQQELMEEIQRNEEEAAAERAAAEQEGGTNGATEETGGATETNDPADGEPTEEE